MIRRVDLPMKLDANARLVFSLHYHLILVVKYRFQAFVDEIFNRAREIFEYVVYDYKMELAERRRTWLLDKNLTNLGYIPIKNKNNCSLRHSVVQELFGI